MLTCVAYLRQVRCAVKFVKGLTGVTDGVTVKIRAPDLTVCICYKGICCLLVFVSMYTVCASCGIGNDKVFNFLFAACEKYIQHRRSYR